MKRGGMIKKERDDDTNREIEISLQCVDEQMVDVYKDIV